MNNETNQPQTDATPTSQPSQPKKVKASTWTWLIVLILIIVGGTMYLKSQNPADMSSDGKDSTTSGLVSENDSDSALPNSYVYPSGELSLSFPNGWYPHDKHGQVFFLKKPNTPDITDTEIYAYGDQITIGDANLTDKAGNKLTRAQYEAYLVKNPPATKDMEGNPINRTSVNINGIKMTRVDQLEYAGSNRTLTYSFLSEDLEYFVRLFPYEPESKDANNVQLIKDFEAMVQTIKLR